MCTFQGKKNKARHNTHVPPSHKCPGPRQTLYLSTRELMIQCPVLFALLVELSEAGDPPPLRCKIFICKRKVGGKGQKIQKMKLKLLLPFCLCVSCVEESERLDFWGGISSACALCECVFWHRHVRPFERFLVCREPQQDKIK